MMTALGSRSGCCLLDRNISDSEQERVIVLVKMVGFSTVVPRSF